MVFSGVVNCCPCWMQTSTEQTTRVAEQDLLYVGQMVLIQQWLNPVKIFLNRPGILKCS